MCLFLGAQIGLGQVYLKSDRNSIKLAYEFDEEGKVYPVPTFLDSLNILKVISNDSIDKFIASYYFKKDTIYEYKDNPGTAVLCYQIKLVFFCGICAENHLKKILNDRNDKWVQISENKYITKNKYDMVWSSDKQPTVYNCGVMYINRSSNENKCLQLDVRLEKFERKEWRRLVKKK